MNIVKVVRLTTRQQHYKAKRREEVRLVWDNSSLCPEYSH